MIVVSVQFYRSPLDAHQSLDVVKRHPAFLAAIGELDRVLQEETGQRIMPSITVSSTDDTWVHNLTMEETGE